MAKLNVFSYPHGDKIVERKVIVLNEDISRIGGIEVNGLDDSTIKELEEAFKDVKVTDFSRKQKAIDPNTGLPVEKQRIDTFGAPYKAYAKSKILH